mmetsp:Transcript_53885/g.61912  ORF Transcript_53885/g.61912 Transcript_53885/m.61912 type:complete len:153 (+) Transcript_53885:43-501(+)
MLRRVAPKPLSSIMGLRCSAAPMAVSWRFSGGVSHHDHTHAFSRPLTPEESIALEDQKKRTVSGIVPGKLFMRHWTAAEQSTVSIVNRVVSLIVTLGIFIWATGYASLGYNGLNAWHVAILATLANWIVLHTHMLWLYPIMLGVTLAQLLFN